MSALTKEAILVRNALLLQGLETPLNNRANLDIKKRKYYIVKHIISIMNLLNLDITHDSLIQTPNRIAKMYVEEIFSGLNYLNFPKISILKNTMKINEMIIVKKINLTSTCEHHFIIFSGYATIAYIPEESVIGLSKINRIVQFFSKRPQLQERLTRQIFLALKTLLNTKNVAISIEAMHYCVKARGVHDTASSTVTNSLGGLFKYNRNIREEFFYSIARFNN